MEKAEEAKDRTAIRRITVEPASAACHFRGVLHFAVPEPVPVPKIAAAAHHRCPMEVTVDARRLLGHPLKEVSLVALVRRAGKCTRHGPL